MSTFGYNGDISNSASSGQSGFSQNSINGTSFELNHFVHGMHSFNTASQLQFYLERMAAPGARVNITHVAHLPTRNNRAAINHASSLTPSTTSQSSSQIVVPSRSPVFSPAPPAPPPSPAYAFSSGGNRLAGSQPATALVSASPPVVVGPPMINRANLPTPGYDRRYMMVICHLHDREGTPEVTPDDGFMNPFGSAGSGPRYSQGYCSICRRVVRVDSRGRAIF